MKRFLVTKRNNLGTNNVLAGLIGIGLLACLAANVASGQSTNSNGNAKGKDKPSIAKRPTVIPRDGSLDSDPDADGQKGKPATPGRPDKTPLPSDVSDLVKQFQQERENYLKKQKTLDLINKSKDATQDERAALREQMKESLERLKEQQKALRQEMRDRAKDLKNELNPSLGRVVNGAQDEGRGR